MVAPPGGVKSDRKIGVDQSLGRRLPETAPFALSRSAAFFLLSFVTSARGHSRLRADLLKKQIGHQSPQQ
jgi:hypothetical protein